MAGYFPGRPRMYKLGYYRMDRKGDKKIKISRNKNIKTLLLADDHVIVADSEDAVHISVHKLETVTTKYGKKI
jgi:hypothetical protein